MKNISFSIKIPKIEFSNQRKFQFKMTLSILVVIAIFVAKQYFNFDFAETLILIFFGFSIVWKITGRVAVVLALFFLAGTPMMLFFGNKELAETFAVYAYYFLVIAIASEILLLKREKPF